MFGKNGEIDAGFKVIVLGSRRRTQVIDRIDGFERIASCPLALTAHASTLCPIHRCIDDAMEQLEQAFRKLVIQDVIQQLSSPDFQCERLLSLRIPVFERSESFPPKC